MLYISILMFFISMFNIETAWGQTNASPSSGEQALNGEWNLLLEKEEYDRIRWYLIKGNLLHKAIEYDLFLLIEHLSRSHPYMKAGLNNKNQTPQELAQSLGKYKALDILKIHTT